MKKNPLIPSHLLSIILLLVSCSTRESETDGGRNGEATPVNIYVGEMFYLPETKEFYTPLHFNNAFDEREASELLKSGDSILYDAGGRARMRIPLSSSRLAFDLEGLDSVFIYDWHHVLLTAGRLMRVEYFRENYEEKFIAVYSADRLPAELSEKYYCTSVLMNRYYLQDFSHRLVNNESLNEYVIHQLGAEASRWAITNVEVLPARVTYSIVNSPSGSFITELRNNEFNTVISMKEGFRIHNILPLPFEINERPLMFITTYIQGKKLLKTSLAVFADYQEYKFLENNRLTKKELKQ